MEPQGAAMRHMMICGRERERDRQRLRNHKISFKVLSAGCMRNKMRSKERVFAKCAETSKGLAES